MVTYQPDSPSPMCDGSLDEAARMVDRAGIFEGLGFSRSLVQPYMPLKQPYHVYTHQPHFGPRVAHCPEATQVCIVRAPVHPPTPMSLHHLTPSYIPSLLLDVQRFSSVLSQASGMGHLVGRVLSSRTPHSIVCSSPEANM
jgi:hypothetical protein